MSAVHTPARRQGKTLQGALAMLGKVDDPSPELLDVLMADLRRWGAAVVRDGKRLDPADFFHDPG